MLDVLYASGAAFTFTLKSLTVQFHLSSHLLRQDEPQRPSR
jgi:hypothetical protein